MVCRANTSWHSGASDNGMLLHIHRAMHAVLDRNPHHGIHFRVLTKILRLSGGDHLHSGTVVGKLEGDRDATLGWIDIMRDSFIRKTVRAVSSSIRTGARCPASFRLPRVVSTSGTCRRWSPSSATTRCCSSVAAPWVTLGQRCRRRRQPRAVEACVEARNQGRELEKEGKGHLTQCRQEQPGTQGRDGDLERDQVRVRHRRQAGRLPQVNAPPAGSGGSLPPPLATGRASLGHHRSKRIFWSMNQ